MEIDSNYFNVETGNYDAANPLVLPSKSPKKLKSSVEKIAKRRRKILSKKQKKKLEKIVERREKKKNRADLLNELQKHQIQKNLYEKLTPLVKIQTEGLKKVFSKSLQKSKEEKYENYSENDNSEEEAEEMQRVSIDESTSDSEQKDIHEGDATNIISNELAKEEFQNENINIEEANISRKVNNTEKSKLNSNQNVVTRKNRCISSTNLTNNRKHVPVFRTENIESIRSKLPIISEEQAIIESINENLVTILTGETGSGKTTQVPQFLFEAGYATPPKVIGITEPRRVAAIAMANRVATELNLTSEVSYQIRFEGNTTKETRIKFMTDGVLLKEIEKDFTLSKYSVICLDEAHERSLFTDILIGLLSRLVHIRQKRGDPLRLVIMSATLRIEDFTNNHFLFPISPSHLHIPTRQYSVQNHFLKRTPKNYMEAAYKKVLQIHQRLPSGGILVFVTGQEEVKQLTKQLKQSSKRSSFSPFINKRNRKNAKISDETEKTKVIEYDLDKIALSAVKNISKVVDDDGNRSNDEEIDGSSDDLNDSESEADEVERRNSEDNLLGESLHVIPLYSMLPTKEQQKIFIPPPSNTRLCVVATNVAETSLTIPSIRYVVDSGKVKLKLWDKLTGVQTFSITWASKASAEQRSGRAGRTGPGHCYRLYSSAVFNNDFPEYTEPEIRVRPVEDMVLLMKSMSINRVHRFPYPTPPNSLQLEAAEKLLLHLGALEIPSDLVSNAKEIDKSRITAVGRTMSHLPLSPRFSRMIAISFSYDVLEHVITLVAALSVQEILLQDNNEQHDKNSSKSKWLQIRKKWAGSGTSKLLGDCMVLLRAVGAFEFDGGSPESCLKFGLRYKAMIEIRKLRKQLTNDINLMLSKHENTAEILLNPKMKPPSDEECNLLRQILLSGFPDRLARKIHENEIPSTGENSNVDRKKYKYGYWCGDLMDPVYLHESSVLRTSSTTGFPEWIIYQEAFESNNKIYLRGITAIDPSWILPIAQSLCVMEQPSEDPPPFYDEETGKIMCYVKSTYGKRMLQLPLTCIEYPITCSTKYKLFGQYFLNGDMFPRLKSYKQSLLSNPSLMIKSWARLQPRTQILLQGIASHQLEKKADLIAAWKKNSSILLNEYLEWIPKQVHDEIRNIWPPL